jgi:hypothetical protein
VCRCSNLHEAMEGTLSAGGGVARTHTMARHRDILTEFVKVRRRKRPALRVSSLARERPTPRCGTVCTQRSTPMQRTAGECGSSKRGRGWVFARRRRSSDVCATPSRQGCSTRSCCTAPPPTSVAPAVTSAAARYAPCRFRRDASAATNGSLSSLSLPLSLRCPGGGRQFAGGKESSASLLRERNAIDSSLGGIDAVINQAQASLTQLSGQRELFEGMRCAPQVDERPSAHPAGRGRA